MAYIAVAVNFMVAWMMFEREDYAIATIPLLVILFILGVEYLVEKYRRKQ